MTVKEFRELRALYAYFIPAWDSNDPFEDLLYEHAIIIYDLLQRRTLPADAKKITIKLDSAQALAFYDWWQMIDTSGNIAGHVIICRVVGEIDRASKQVTQILALL